MGTSASVSGAGPGVPLIPDWVEDVGDETTNEDETQQAVTTPSPLVPERRLIGARRALGEFVSSGNRAKMQRGVGNYVRSGRGGAGLATRRSAGSARRAATLGGIAGGSPEFKQLRDRIRGALASDADAHELLAAIAAAASPLNGTLDSETGQQSASEALQHVLERFPDADLFALDGNQREILLERFLAIDCFGLFYTETGEHIQGKSDYSTAASRINEIKNYFCETFRQANERRRDAGSPSLGDLTDRQIAAECRNVISEAYIIFEAYLDEG